MRLSTRLKMAVAAVLVCLLLLVAFSGTASAHTLRSLSSSGTPPRISVTPRQVITDAAGCATGHIDARGLPHSILSPPNSTTMNIAVAHGDVLTHVSVVA